MNFDIVVIGGGPGGYVAAIRAAQLGLKTALVERKHLGGICLNWGCIPTKALLKSAEVYHLVQHAEEFGIKVKGISFDFEKIIARSRATAEKLSSGIKHLLKKNKVEVFEGHGKVTKSKTVLIENEGKKVNEINAKHIIIATGARARVLPGIEPDGEHIWSYKEAMTPKNLPKSLIIIGSGAIGIEFASFYNMFGVEVTVLERSPHILPHEDYEISQLAHKAFEKRGMKLITNAHVNKVTKKKVGIEISYEADGKIKTLEADRIISAVGIVANVENIGLENTKVQLDRGFIKTNPYLETDEPGIYAIGDVTSPPWLAHKASHEGIICVEKIAGLKDIHPLKLENIPGCTYCYPQIASIGLTEEKAKEKGLEIKVGRFPYFGNGKAMAIGETEGLIKTIFCAKTGELIGAHMVGAEVTEMIQGFGLVKNMEGTELDIMHTIFAHPTLSEMMHESTLNAFSRSIHI
ncbi:Dihydrolipoyl dehydrogenase [Candidatus Jidaibacter acanthamoeba]|uniref:Dihydrolipoyl dehydrogenase n=1 Tax=Candidatus Jidaibacter acanthamoebae TaxID=86105 RepID=A0A0C1N0Z4_9RICK|nr:dihydrolipoyl dehydrogenase [Candidatus Jidaibacter acanthamoeba]KIE05976.1 Dihydrolipoyl dehydrogenase [Candidatus Jidaibacter acanthamoeba]